MLVGTTVGLVSFIISLLLGPETKGKEMVSDIEVFVHEPGVLAIGLPTSPACRLAQGAGRRVRLSPASVTCAPPGLHRCAC